MKFFRLQNLALTLCLLGAVGLLATNMPSTAYGQTIVSGDLTGHVTDSSGAVVVGASVALTSDADGSKRNVTTDTDGSFRFPLLRPGTYSLKVTANGLVGAAKSVTVSVGKLSAVNIVAKVASVATEVVVDSSSQPLLQTEDANITTVVDSRAIEQLPVPGGDIMTLAFTAPGVNLSTGGGYGGFVAFGLPATDNLFTLNGNDIMDPYLNLNNSGASNLTLGANELADVAIVNNGYNAQYGRYPGTQINYTTKSGSNKFHGNLQYFWNGRALNANDWINKNTQISGAYQDAIDNGATPAQAAVAGAAANKRPFANSNQWSAAVGGPIWRNKLFFFFDTEGMRYVLPGGGGTTYIPTVGFMNDVVANVTKLHPSEAAYYQKIATLYAGASGAKGASNVAIGAYDGSTPSNCGGADGAVLNGTTYGYYNVSGTTASVGATCTRQFYAAVNNLNTEALWSARADQVIGSNDHASYRIHHDWGVQATGTDAINSAFNANSVQPEWEGQFNETHTFSPKLANTLILSGLYYSALFGPPNFSASVAVFPTTLEFFDGQGFANLGGTNYNYPQGRNVQQYQIVDDLSVLWNRHSLKFGINYRGNKISDFRSGVNKAGHTDFNSMLDFANGVTDNGSTVTQAFSTKGQVPVEAVTFGLYAQDDWAVSDKLKLTLSLRMDHNANFRCLSNCFSRLTSDFTGVAHDVTVPYNKVINIGLGNAFPATDWMVLQPRAGFSYAPMGQTGRFVVRGGAGLFSELAPGTIADRFLTNAPNIATFTYSGAALVDATSTSGSAYNFLKSSATAFQTGFTNGSTLAQIQAAVVASGSKYSAPSFNSVANKVKTPKVMEWNLEGQVQVSRSDVLDFNYVGNYSWDGLMLDGLENIHSKFGMAGLPITAPDPRFNIITDLTNNGRANYNGLTSSIRHTARFGLTLTANYTYSHALDLASNGGLEGFNLANITYPQQQLAQNSTSRLNYGNADYDIRHSSSFQYVWTIPYKPANALLRTGLKGWSVSGNLFYRGGYPMSVINSQINSRQLGSASYGGLLASLVSGNNHGCNAKPGSDINVPVCFKGDTFASVPSTSVYTYGFGNTARNSFGTPHYFNSDLQLNKETQIREKHTLKVGANFFNVLNHANFAPAYNSVTSGAFGTISNTVTPPSSPYGSFEGSAVSGRVVQLLTSFTF